MLSSSNAGKESSIKWTRDGGEMNSKLTVSPDSTIGVGIGAKYTGPVKQISYSVFSAFPKAAADMYYYGIELFFGSIYKIIKGDIPFKKAIGGLLKLRRSQPSLLKADS